jgi:hypothetical protein
VEWKHRTRDIDDGRGRVVLGDKGEATEIVPVGGTFILDFGWGFLVGDLLSRCLVLRSVCFYLS